VKEEFLKVNSSLTDSSICLEFGSFVCQNDKWIKRTRRGICQGLGTSPRRPGFSPEPVLRGICGEQRDNASRLSVLRCRHHSANGSYALIYLPWTLCNLSKYQRREMPHFKEGMSKYIDIIISQNTTQFYAQYVQCILQLRVSAHFWPSSGCSFIA